METDIIVKKEEDQRDAEVPPFRNGKIFIPVRNGWEVLDPAHIMFIEGNGSYVEIHLVHSGIRTISKNLKQFLALLPAQHNFLRVQKSFIVNSDFINSIYKSNGGFLKLSSGIDIPVSKSYWKDILNLMKPF